VDNLAERIEAGLGEPFLVEPTRSPLTELGKRFTARFERAP
jgi:hypothetical protein